MHGFHGIRRAWTARSAIRVRLLLANARWPWYAAILGFVLSVVAWPSGFQLDDFYHRMILRGDVEQGNGHLLLDLFTFSRGDPARNQIDRASGVTPWWTAPGYRMNFFRPLAAVTHWVDHACWPQQKWLMHAQCSLWFAGAIVAVGFLFRRLFSHCDQDEGDPGSRTAQAAAAGLATLLFALRDEHAITIAWIANRNLLMMTLFGSLAWLLHCAGRNPGRRAAAWASPVCFGLALLCGEASVAIGGCLLAYALLLDRGPLRARLLSLAPCAAVGVVWLVTYQLFHGGASESDNYLDPKHDLVGFAAEFLRRAPVYLGSAFGFSSANGLTFSRPFVQPIIVGTAAVGVGIVASLLFAPLRRDRLLQFFALCLVPAMVPLCAGLATDRLMMLFNIPASGLMARFIQLVFQHAPELPQTAAWQRPARALAGLWVVLHTAVAAVLLPLFIVGFGAYGEAFRTAACSRPFENPDFARQDLILVNAPDGHYAPFVSFARADEALQRPVRTRMLASSLSRFDVARPDPYTLELHLPDGLIADTFSRMYRSVTVQPFVAGQQMDLPRMRVTVLECTARGQPTRVAYRFPVALEDRSLCLVEWKDGAFVDFRPPAVGMTRHMPAASRWTIYHLEPLQTVAKKSLEQLAAAARYLQSRPAEPTDKLAARSSGQARLSRQIAPR